MHRKDRVIVEIAEERDGETVQTLGPAAEKYFLALEAGPHRFHQHTVGGQRGDRRRACQPDEFSSVDSGKEQALLSFRSRR